MWTVSLHGRGCMCGGCVCVCVCAECVPCVVGEYVEAVYFCDGVFVFIVFVLRMFTDCVSL